ncbi:MAG TPA: nucleotidyltransferase domain-containing protein [Polyangiaceae bacterium]
MSVIDRAQALLEAEPAVRLAYVFGSTARGDGRAASDVDLGVVLDAGGQLGELAERVERGIGQAVDLVDLRRAPPLLLHEVLRDGVVVVCRDDLERAEFESRALAEYLDTQHLRDVQREYLRERVESRLGPSR